MARTTPKPQPLYVTALEDRPEYLQAIGTLAVEVVNVEVMLAYLLAMITRLPIAAADEMYFGPQSMGARIPIVAGAVVGCLSDKQHYKERAERCLTDARKLANKRNDVLHNAWGVSSTNKKVTRQQLPFSDRVPPKHVPLSAISDTIYSARMLITRVRAIAQEVGADADYSPWQNIRPVEAPDGNNAHQEVPQTAPPNPPPPSRE